MRCNRFVYFLRSKLHLFVVGLFLLSFGSLFACATHAGPPISRDLDPTHSGTVASTPGTPYPWVGASGSVNTGTGNNHLTVPLVGWTNRGGVGFSDIVSTVRQGKQVTLPNHNH